MTHVFKLTLLLALLGASLLYAQGAPQDAREKEAIERAKQVLVSELEPGMPKITLDYFLQYEAGKDARITWEMNDCGEQTGDPRVDSQRDIPTCAEADAALPDGRTLVVFVGVGSVRTGWTAKPSLFSVSILGRNAVKQLKLSDVPKELHPMLNPDEAPRDIDRDKSSPVHLGNQRRNLLGIARRPA